MKTKTKEYFLQSFRPNKKGGGIWYDYGFDNLDKIEMMSWLALCRSMFRKLRFRVVSRTTTTIIVDTVIE